MADMRPQRHGTDCSHPVAPRGAAGRARSSARSRRYAIDLKPVLDEIARMAGRSTWLMASELTRRGVRKPRGGIVWTPPEVRLLLLKIKGIVPP